MRIHISHLFILLFITIHLGIAGDLDGCDCGISDVNLNQVKPCRKIIGPILNVTTEREFIEAIDLANKEGGNMTILIRNGVYRVATSSWYPYLTADNVVIRSYSGQRDSVILHGSGMKELDQSAEIGIYIAGNHVTVADLTIKQLGNHGLAVSGNDFFAHNLKIQDTYEQMIKGNSKGKKLKNSIVQCSLFEYTEEVGPQWYIGGLDIHGGVEWNVRDNIFKNIASPADKVAEHAIHFWDYSSDNLVERNLIVNCDRGIGFGLGVRMNEGGMIKNNMITNLGNGKFNDVGISLESSPGTRVYNNTIIVEYKNAIEFRFSTTNDVDISNNLSNKPIKSRDGGKATLQANYINASKSWFSNLRFGDLHIQDKQESIVCKGIYIEEVMLDMDRTARNRPCYDIGADQIIDIKRR